MTDAVVAVAPDSSGKNIANQSLTRADGTTLVHRQETVSADANNPTAGGLGAVEFGRQAVDARLQDMIYLELVRIRIGIGQMVNQDLSNIQL